MAVRLCVVMVHSPPPSAKVVVSAGGGSAEQFAEGVIGELIGLSGVDVTLVGPIAHLAETSTDRLTLGSLSGDVAVLDWQSPSDIMSALESIGFEGQRAAHPADRDAPRSESNVRRVYAFDLNAFSQSKRVVAALTELKSSRQVRTFTLGPLPLAPATTPQPPHTTSVATSESVASVAAESPTNDGSLDRPSARQDSPAGHAASPISGAAASQQTPGGEKLDLDDLLDQLDDLDP